MALAAVSSLCVLMAVAAVLSYLYLPFYFMYRTSSKENKISKQIRVSSMGAREVPVIQVGEHPVVTWRLLSDGF